MPYLSRHALARADLVLARLVSNCSIISDNLNSILHVDWVIILVNSRTYNVHSLECAISNSKFSSGQKGEGDQTTVTDGKLYCYFVRKIGKNDDGEGERVKKSSNYDDVICKPKRRQRSNLQMIYNSKFSLSKNVNIQVYLLLVITFTTNIFAACWNIII